MDSTVTANYHAGNPPDSRSVAIAQSNGITISNQTARSFKVSNFDTFDIIYAMDNSNLKNIAKLARHMSDLAKIKLILEIDERAQDKNIPDPYYNEFSGFKIVFQLLDNATSIIAKQLLK